MRVENKLFFAPDIEFKDLRWDDLDFLIEVFAKRVEGFYFAPTELLLGNGQAFGAGVLCATIIDFLAAFSENTNTNVGQRYERWLKQNLGEFAQPNPDDKTASLAKRFYDEFRNGLVHEGRIKNAGQFSFENESIISFESGAMIIDPRYLFGGIIQAYKIYLDSINQDEFSRQKFRSTLIGWFSEDMKHVQGK
jgi:hypothetical protein